MFVWVKSKITGHKFDIQESRFDEKKHTRVKGVSLSKHPRKTKFNVGKTPAFSVSTAKVEEGDTHESDDA